MLELMRGLEGSGYPLIAMPNASYPSLVNGRTMYLDNPAYFSDCLLELRRLGISVLGGCCGTTPKHMQAAAQKLQALGAVKLSAPKLQSDRDAVREPEAFSGTHKTVAVELSAPVGPQADELLEAAARLRDRLGLPFDIEADGCCNERWYRALRDAGVGTFVLGGSGLFGKDADTARAITLCLENLERELS